MKSTAGLLFRVTGILLILQLFSFIVPAQNIVPNGTLDDANLCDEYQAVCSPAAWFNANRKAARSYFPAAMPIPIKANRYLGFIAAYRFFPTRRYWQTRFLCPLQAGNKYTVSLKIAALGIGPNLHDIGFYFTDHFIFATGDTLLLPANYLSFLDAKVTDLKNGWFELNKEIVPSADAGFLIIGNFSPESNRSIVNKRKADREVEMLIDDIVIESVTPLPCPDYEKIRDSLYSITRRHSDTLPPGSLVALLPHLPDIPDILHPPANTPAPKKDTTPPAFPDTSGNPTLPATTLHTDTVFINAINFEFDSYHLTDPNLLEKYRPLLSQADIKKIKVVGYTDERGSQSYNKELSERRAAEVARLLTVRFGIPASAIQAAGMGISKDFRDDQRNRRVEIIMYR